MGSLCAQRGDRQRLGGCPIDALAGFDRGALCFELSGYFRIEVKALRDGDESLSQIPQYLDRDAGITATVTIGRLLEAGPCSFEPVCLVRSIIFGRLELRFEAVDETGCDRRRLSLVDNTCRDDAARIDFPRRRMARDRAVHQRLGKRRLVALVVPVPAIAKQVDDDVLLELLAVFGGGASDLDNGFGIIAVNMKDRRLDALCNVRGIRARSRRRRARREADLVVDDDVNGAAGAKAVEIRQFERFGDEALAGE